MLQCVAVCYSVMQYVTVCCSMLQCDAVFLQLVRGDAAPAPFCTYFACVPMCVAVCCRVLQCVAECYSVVAVFCSVLQFESVDRMEWAVESGEVGRERLCVDG